MNLVIATCVRPNLSVKAPMAQWVAAQLCRRARNGSVWGEMIWDVCPGNYIDAQRNYLVESHRDAEAILFVDADVCPPPGALEALIALDAPVAVAPCPIHINGADAYNVVRGDGYLSRLPEDPFPIVRGGTACMLIRRAVFESLPWPWFKTGIRRATPNDPELVTYTDDEFFCDLCAAEGIAMWADPRVVCRHPV